MLETFRYESRRRLRGTLVLATLLSLLVLLYVALFPSIQTSGVDFEAYVESFPPALQSAFGGVVGLSTIEGFLAVEYFQFVLRLLLGVYFAYLAASVIAGDVERGRMDLLLATPVSRSRLLVEKYLALVTPLAVLTVVLFAVAYGGVLAIGESISLADLAAAQLLAVPYLLACAAIGLLLSVLFDRADIAQRAAIGVVFGLYLLDSVSRNTDYEWLGALSPSRYYDPTAVLVNGEYDLLGALILLAGAAALVFVARERFRRADVP